MKKLKILFFVVTVFLSACGNQKQKADKDMKNDAILIENAKVKGEKPENNRNVNDSIRHDSIGTRSGKY